MEQVAKETAGKAKFVGVDVDKAPNAPAQFGVMSLPTLLFIKGGKEVTRLVGAVSKAKIEDALKKITR